MKRILFLTIRKQWFDKIKDGIKTEEYREIKPYWDNRLLNPSNEFKEYDIVRFRNGYKKDSPCIDMEFKGITIGLSPVFKKQTYIIHLGKRLE